MRPLLAAVLVLCGCTGSTEPNDSEYYRRTCKAAGMEWIVGTHTCVGPDSSFINLKPPKR